jgi:hypothetical protein
VRQARTALCLALRVQVEQLGRDIADLVGGAFARLGPLVGAELVQRRALGRRARITRHQVQLLHGHVSLSPPAYSSTTNSPSWPATCMTCRPM